MPSSVIRGIAYDAERAELAIGFVSGKAYVYALVPPAVAAAFADAAARGACFNNHVRDRYPFHKARVPRATEDVSSSLRAALKASQGA